MKTVRRYIPVVRSLIVTSGVLASLAFGATEAFAIPLPFCSVPGTCNSNYDCMSLCQQGGYQGGDCIMPLHCCACYS